MRLLRFVTYFTVESNIAAMVMAVSLILRPDRDGSLWRVARVASVVGMTVTFVVYRVALAGILDLHGAAWWTDLGFHVVAPLLTVVGWLLFGPWPRFDTRSVLLIVLWPLVWVVYVLILGAGVDWYPYPFLDAGKHGYPHALVNCLLVAVLLLGVGGVCLLIDRRLARPTGPGRHLTRHGTARPVPVRAEGRRAPTPGRAPRRRAHGPATVARRA